MSPTPVKKTQQQYRAVLGQLEGKLLKLQSRRETMDIRAFVVVDEGVTASPNSPPTGLDERAELYHGEVGSLVSTATDIIIKALQIKLRYVHDILERLSLLVDDNPRQATPTELLFSRYEEWLDSNQQLLEFNSQLYELEKVKFDLKRKNEKTKNTRLATKDELESSTASQLTYKSISKAQSLLDRVQHHSHSSNTTQVYIHELLNPRGSKTTFESQKVQDYIAECFQYAESDIHEVRGIHSERYQEFMEVLCSYIVGKQREWQREDVSSELVYSAVEHCIMPQLKSLILHRISQPERDDIIHNKCHAFSDITMDQLRVKPQLQTNEAVPFIDAITQLRASYFSSTPTDKMYRVVAAVKALYDQLGDMGERSIDGDSFLDLWIYVIIKANVKDLATNLHFMIEYGNPQLGSGEAGYYLTTVEAAVQFIATLTPQILQSPNGEMEFVVCERAHFSSLCSMPGSGLEQVTTDAELQGYRIAVLADWALNRARLFRSALVPTANYLDSAKVAVIRVKQENANPAIVQYLLRQLRAEGLSDKGIFSKSIPLGTAIFIDMTTIDHHNVIILPTGDYDQHGYDVRHILQLQRLGSLSTDPEAERRESCLTSYPSSMTPTHALPLPVSPPSYISKRGEDLGNGQQEGRSEVISTPLWPPYILLGRNISPERENGVCEASFNQLVPGSSIRSEHRMLEQRGYSRDSFTPQQLANSKTVDLLPHSFPRPSHSSGGVWPNTRRQPAPPPHPTTITVQAEVHENSFVPSQRINRPETDSTRGAGVCTDTNAGGGYAVELLEPNDGLKGTEKSTESRLGTGVVVENCATREREEVEREEEVDGRSQRFDSDYEARTYSRGLRLHSKENEMQSATGTDVVMRDIFSPEYRKSLEEAFVVNHHYESHSQSVAEAAHSLTLQAQLCLQRLNYLSVSYKIIGEYDNITLEAVKTFQRAHNIHGAQNTVRLAENGHLTSLTHSFLRQVYLLVYGSLVKVGLDKLLGENFDPLSTSPENIALFRKCVSELQQQHNVRECQSGSMCGNTIEKVRQLLHEQKRQVIAH